MIISHNTTLPQTSPASPASEHVARLIGGAR